MPRTHGGGVACYKGARPDTGSCVRCRIVNAIRHRNTNRTGGPARCARYRETALGILAAARNKVTSNAKRRST